MLKNRVSTSQLDRLFLPHSSYLLHSDDMLSRLVTSTIRRSLILPIRNLRVSSAILGGGGHDHHAPIPAYQPKPGPSERTYFGEGKSGRVSNDEPYTPGPEDFASYAGAGVFVLLTFLAVAFKTDVFSSDKKGHGHHDSGKKHAPHEKKEEPKEHKEQPKDEKVQQEEIKEEKESESQSAPEAAEESKPEERKEETHASTSVPATPAETSAQPKSTEKEHQDVKERPADQVEPREERDKAAQAEQPKANEPPTPKE